MHHIHKLFEFCRGEGSSQQEEKQDAESLKTKQLRFSMQHKTDSFEDLKCG